MLDNIAGLRRQREHGLFYSEVDLARIDRQAEGRYIILKQCWDSNYGHWLIEGLPRAIPPNGLDFCNYRYLVSSPGEIMRRVMFDCLSELGIKSDQIIVCNDAPRCFSELLYPLPITAAPWVTGPR